MKTRRAFRAARIGAAAGLAAIAFGAGADVVDIVWDSAGRFDKALSVPPGTIAEVCGKLSKGQSVAWTFSAAQPMDFNIHYHEGQEVRYPVRQDQSRAAQGVFDPGSGQTYCWMWTNETHAAIGLGFSLTRR